MVTSIGPSLILHHNPVLAEIHETAFRRRMCADVTEVKEALAKWGRDDEFTEHIRLWVENFSFHLTTQGGSEEIYTGFIRLMQMMLVDPIRLAPLDDEAVIGRDGRVYGKKTLLIYLSKIPESEHYNQPFSPVEEDELARFMVKWLQRQGALQVVPEIEAEFNALENPPTLPTLAALRQHERKLALQERIARIRQNQEEIAQETMSRTEAFQQAAEAIRERIEAAVDGTIGQMQQEQEESFVEQNRLIEEMRERDLIEMRSLNEAHAIFCARVDTLEAQRQVLEREIEKVSRGIQDVNVANIQLEHDIKRLEAIMAKRNSSWLSGLLGVGLAVAVCIAVTCCAPAGFSMSAMKGGAKMAVTFAI